MRTHTDIHAKLRVLGHWPHTWGAGNHWDIGAEIWLLERQREEYGPLIRNGERIQMVINLLRELYGRG